MPQSDGKYYVLYRNPDSPEKVEIKEFTSGSSAKTFISHFVIENSEHNKEEEMELIIGVFKGKKIKYVIETEISVDFDE